MAMSRPSSDARPDGGDLAVEELAAGGGLVGERGAVLGGAALDDVADVDAAPGGAEALLDHLGQQLTRAADEGEAPPVFFGAGPLPDEHEIGLGIPVAEDDLRAPVAKPAAGAVAEGGSHLFEGRRLPPQALACGSLRGLWPCGFAALDRRLRGRDVGLDPVGALLDQLRDERPRRGDEAAGLLG
jgi:hypothetical protein